MLYLTKLQAHTLTDLLLPPPPPMSGGASSSENVLDFFIDHYVGKNLNAKFSYGNRRPKLSLSRANVILYTAGKESYQFNWQFRANEQRIS